LDDQIRPKDMTAAQLQALPLVSTLEGGLSPFGVRGDDIMAFVGTDSASYAPHQLRDGSWAKDYL